MRTCLTIITLLLLAACGSSPKTNFYTLNEVPGSTGRRSISYPVQLAAVHVPASLDRRQMVNMTGANSIRISETNQWSAPFDIMVRNVLARDLVARLPKNRVILPEAPAPEGTGTLVVTITSFLPHANGEVTFSGSWSLLKGGNPIKERPFQFKNQGAANAESTAGTMSAMLGQLADQIVAALTLD
jgi:uncharacterized protein